MDCFQQYHRCYFEIFQYKSCSGFQLECSCSQNWQSVSNQANGKSLGVVKKTPAQRWHTVCLRSKLIVSTSGKVAISKETKAVMKQKLMLPLKAFLTCPKRLPRSAKLIGSVGQHERYKHYELLKGSD